MSTDYANATIANVPARDFVFPEGTPQAQPPIGVTALDGISGSVNMWTGHIGLSQLSTATAQQMATNPVTNAGYPAAPGTRGRGVMGGAQVWASCPDGCDPGELGTLVDGVFTPGAGTDQVIGGISPGGFGWVADK